jgi:putative restriction endonuclease
MPNRPWTRTELLQVLHLYCVTSFGKIHARNPEIVLLAKLIDRTPSSVALKMTNFAGLDPTIARTGMSNHSKLDKAVWTDFFNNMDAFLNEAETPEDRGELSEPQIEFIHATRAGIDVMRITKTRVNQTFFRKLILASYDNKCALTGIDTPELLVASHIVPWSVDISSRTNPANGICLNALHDRAFDEGLITFDRDLSILYSPRMPPVTKDSLMSFGDTKMRLPSKFVPEAKFLDYHRSTVFIT